MMRALAIAALALLSACATTGVDGAPSASAPLQLPFAGAPAETDRLFRQSLLDRFGQTAGRDAVLRDLAGAGFQCDAKASFPNVAQGAVMDACEWQRPNSPRPCIDRYLVDLRFAGATRALDSLRVEPVGRFVRECGPR